MIKSRAYLVIEDHFVSPAEKLPESILTVRLLPKCVVEGKGIQFYSGLYLKHVFFLDTYCFPALEGCFIHSSLSYGTHYSVKVSREPGSFPQGRLLVVGQPQSPVPSQAQSCKSRSQSFFVGKLGSQEVQESLKQCMSHHGSLPPN